MIRSNRHTLFVISLLVLAIAATSIPPSVAQARVGEIILDPTHAVPGTLVTFEGVGWYLPVPIDLDCQVNGVPVKVDRHCMCNIMIRTGIYEPVGTFVVANVPAGDYSIFVDIEPKPSGAWLTGEAAFTVDAVTTVAAVATTTLATSVTPHTSTLTTSASPASVLTVTATVTTTKAESPSMPQAADYTTVLAPLSIVVICLVAIAAVVLLRKKAKPIRD